MFGIEKDRKTLISQIVVRGAIFLLFFIGVFVSVPSVVLYLILPFILVNIFLGFVNEHRSIVVNVIFLVLYPLLFLFLIDYIATIVGSFVGAFHFANSFKLLNEE